MISISKYVLSISTLLTMLVALKFNGSEASLFTKTTIQITNKLPNGFWLGVHCKDKDHDLDPQSLQPNQSWSFRFRRNLFMPRTLYFCRFTWKEGDHSFDVYEQKRDSPFGHFINWDISPTGGCRDVDMDGKKIRQCIGWNNDSNGGGRKLGHGNNDNNATTTEV